MRRVVIIGGGWAGCSAALTARHAGADEVIVLERSDCLLGTGMVGGIMRNNGRHTAAEESIALGAGTLFELADRNAAHRSIAFPGHEHALMYDITRLEPAVRRCLLDEGIEIWLLARVTGVARCNGSLSAVTLENGVSIEGDAFVDATGSFGPQSFCTEHGNGCVMCIMRCPTFGPRVSVAALAGVAEKQGRKAGGALGAMSGSFVMSKDTLAPSLVRELEAKGVAVVPLPPELVDGGKLGGKACQQYALPEYAENLVLLHNGHVKLMTTYMPLDQLTQLPGFENARYEDPYAGTVGNSMRFAALSPRDDALRVVGGVDNLFCGGEKAGLLVGHTEAMVTGALAGHNAVRCIAGRDLLVLPDTLAIGDAISHVRQAMETEEGMGLKYTFSGSVYFERMKERGLYSTDDAAIAARVEAAGLAGIYRKRVL
jgi:hypothetical protein